MQTNMLTELTQRNGVLNSPLFIKVFVEGFITQFN